jgi:hypothetical protein
LQCHRCRHHYCAYIGIWRPDRPSDCAYHWRRGRDHRGVAEGYGFPRIGLVSRCTSKPQGYQVGRHPATTLA